MGRINTSPGLSRKMRIKNPKSHVNTRPLSSGTGGAAGEDNKQFKVQRKAIGISKTPSGGGATRRGR